MNKNKCLVEDIATNMNNKNKNKLMEQKRVLVPVVYYLSRNSQLQHPHFVEVPLSSPQGLFLRDVVNRLNLVRGKSMASQYSWSSKRCYKNGYVWHDLEENDFIQPVHGGEYVLKGSEILETSSLSTHSVSKSSEVSSSSSNKSNIIPSVGDSELSPLLVARNQRRNPSWGSIDLNEYKVYKAESTREFAAANASTQTDDKRVRRKAVVKEEQEIEEEQSDVTYFSRDRRQKMEQCSTELSRGEISPPPSDSSPETAESSITTASSISSSLQAIDQVAGGIDRTIGNSPSGRMKASSVLMSLISCGSISFRDLGDKDVSLISPYKPRMSPGEHQTVDDNGIKNDNGDMMMKMMEKNVSRKFEKMALEDKEYFSGSLIENNTNNQQLISLKRSSSYNADRSPHLELNGKEVDGVRAKCIPRRPKAQSSNKKDCHLDWNRN